MSETVLAVIELDKFPKQVAKRAAWLAERHGFSLHLMLSDPALTILRDSFIVSNEAQQVASGIEDAQRQLLADLTDSITANPELGVSSDISHDRPAHDAVIAKALDIEPRFVVKGTQYHGAAERATFAHADWQLIRHLRTPLWLVKEESWNDQPVVLAAVDPIHQQDPEAHLDDAIVAAAKDLVAKSDGKLILLHTYERLVEIGEYAKLSFKPVKVPVDELDNAIRDRHREKLDELAAAHDVPEDAVHQLPGRTRDILPTFARAHGANVVVMGAVARSGLKRRVLGSTAERVLDHLHCDILIVHAD